MQAVQSLGGSNDFATWIDAFEYMKNKISTIDFDIALLGCGAYGMPLGLSLKKNCKNLQFMWADQCSCFLVSKGNVGMIYMEINYIMNIG